MSDIYCGACADRKPCMDHPNEIVGSEWAHSITTVKMTVLAWSPVVRSWLTATDGYIDIGRARAEGFANWTRLPASPPPMPKLDITELWAAVWDNDHASFNFCSSAGEVLESFPTAVGAVRFDVVPDTWTPRT